jgi:formylglycine-generating enzyme required for sulfatase activity
MRKSHSEGRMGLVEVPSDCCGGVKGRVAESGVSLNRELDMRATCRNFFPPATRWQFSGIRLAK